MDELERFDLEYDDIPNGGRWMNECTDGEWVRFDDVEKLIETLREQVRALGGVPR